MITQTIPLMPAFLYAAIAGGFAFNVQKHTRMIHGWEPGSQPTGELGIVNSPYWTGMCFLSMFTKWYIGIETFIRWEWWFVPLVYLAAQICAVLLTFPMMIVPMLAILATDKEKRETVCIIAAQLTMSFGLIISVGLMFWEIYWKN